MRKRERECLPPGQVEYAGVVLLPVGDKEAEVNVPHHAEHSKRQHLHHQRIGDRGLV